MPYGGTPFRKAILQDSIGGGDGQRGIRKGNLRTLEFLDDYLIEIAARFTDATTLDTRGNNTFNQYTSVGDAMQTHDLNGNVTYDGNHTYVWDAFNRLAQVKDGTTVVATYSYDTQGRRMRKVVGSATRDFAYDGWRSIAEYPSAARDHPRPRIRLRRLPRRTAR